MTAPAAASGERVVVAAVETRARALVEALAAELPRQLGCEAAAAHLSVDPERFYDSQRGQYWSTPMLAELDAVRPAGASRILGLTSVDLFVPVLTFVFGEAHVAGTAAVVSAHRLDPAAYGLPADPARTAARVFKEAVHELGHTYGLLHCRDYACVMRASRAVEEVDTKSAGFCPDCAARLTPLGLRPAVRPA